MEVSISDLLNEGKKFLSDEKYNNAIMQFQKIDELLNKGQIKDAGEMEIAETYFLYGKSLMLKYTYISNDDLENDDSVDEKSMKLLLDNEEDDSRSSDMDEEEKEKEKEMQQAYQYLNLAKEKYLKKAESSKDAALILSEIYSLFAEYEEETDCDKAIISMISCINVLKKHLNYDTRKLLIYHHDLGHMYMSAEKYTDAIQVFQKCKKDIIRMLRAMKNTTKMANNDAGKEEIAHIKGLLFSVKKYIKDSKRYASQDREYHLSSSARTSLWDRNLKIFL